MRKGFSIFEIIIGIIFIGMISEMMVGISQLKKINTNSNININNHILLESELEQAKGNCCYLNNTTCSSRGGTSSGSNLLAIGDSCSYSYDTDTITYYQMDDNWNFVLDGSEQKISLDHMTPNEITTICKKVSDGFFNIDVTLKTPKSTLKGNALVNSCI